MFTGHELGSTKSQTSYFSLSIKAMLPVLRVLDNIVQTLDQPTQRGQEDGAPMMGLVLL